MKHMTKNDLAMQPVWLIISPILNSIFFFFLIYVCFQQQWHLRAEDAFYSVLADLDIQLYLLESECSVLRLWLH